VEQLTRRGELPGCWGPEFPTPRSPLHARPFGTANFSGRPDLDRDHGLPTQDSSLRALDHPDFRHPNPLHDHPTARYTTPVLSTSPLAGFDPATTGRFWVAPEARMSQRIADRGLLRLIGQTRGESGMIRRLDLDP